MYKGNNEIHSLKYCCGEKVIRVTNSEGVYVALLIQHEKCMRLLVVASVASLEQPVFFYIISKTERFLEKKSF
jgi:hypothetical protein